jgi:hypothetical protein
MVDEKTGLGCPPDDGNAGGSSGISPACDMGTTRLGSPRLALAKAMCVPFQPTLSNVRAVFSATNVTTIPQVAADQQYSQDTDITDVDWIIQNESSTANSNEFQTLSDYYYTLQSGIGASIQVGKAPFYAVAPNFTPLKNLIMGIRRVIARTGWVVGKTQQITMGFNADVAIPYAPVEVIVTFTGEIPETDEFMDGNMTKADAITKLRQLGYCIPPGYAAWTCR